MERNYIIRRVLSENSIEFIKNSIQEGTWVSGMETFGKTSQVLATNLEYSQSNPNYKLVYDEVMRALDSDRDFAKFVMPKSSGGILISKYTKGQYMNIHRDSFSNGNFSTTIFLNDSTKYDGGELCLYINGKEEKIKLDAGWAITYDTGIIHKVNPLIEGERLVIALWTHTQCIDPFIRNLFYDIDTVLEMVQKDEPEPAQSDDFEKYISSKKQLLLGIKNKILRKYYARN
jgi:PKHD-type hydroxylase